MDLDLPDMNKKVTGNASLLRRLIALLADLIIIDFVIIEPFKNLFSKLFSGAEELSLSAYQELFVNSPNYGVLLFSVIFISILAWIYLSVLQYKFGQTIGQMLVRVKVVSQTGELTYLQAFLRNLFIIPVFPFMLLWIIDPIYIFFDKDNRRLSELISKTKVEQEYVVLYGAK
jgi:uncharacterized RDD family membrane protein YckC